MIPFISRFTPKISTLVIANFCLVLGACDAKDLSGGDSSITPMTDEELTLEANALGLTYGDLVLDFPVEDEDTGGGPVTDTPTDPTTDPTDPDDPSTDPTTDDPDEPKWCRRGRPIQPEQFTHVVTSHTKALICHIPPGNPEAQHTILIGIPAVRAHLAHGDTIGPCDGDEVYEPCPEDDTDADTDKSHKKSKKKKQK